MTQKTVEKQKKREKKIEEVIEKGKEVLRQLHLNTFYRYREVGKLVLSSGYEKGHWHSEHRDEALRKWAISHRTFNYMVQLGNLLEIEFRNVVAKFPSVHAWANRPTEKHSPPLPKGPFDIIYADPPWEYEFSLSPRGDPKRHYDTMSVDEICALKIPTTKNAILFLWATNPKLEEALKVIEAWGFQYRTNLVWVKDKIGTGYYFRGQHELLLVAKRGETSVPLEELRFSSVLEAPRKRHSEKPDAVYELIERMYPSRKYVELFARNARQGWESWGIDLKEKS